MMRRFAALLLALCLTCSFGALAESGAIAIQVTDVECDGGIVGRCAVPTDYSVQSIVAYCGAGQSLGYPMQLSIDAFSADGRTQLSYASAASFIQILESTMNGMTVATQQDGQMDETTLTLMMTLKSPGDYADMMISALFPDAQITTTGDAELPPESQALLTAHMQERYDLTNSLFASDPNTTVDDAYCDVVERSYRFEKNGVPYRAAISTAVDAVQITQSCDTGILNVRLSYIAWEVPGITLVVAPESEWDSAQAAFELFTLNTSASAAFQQANLDLSNQIRESALANRSLSGAENTCRSAVSDLTDSSIDNTERFCDYILSQNGYMLPDGSSVKIPLEYDYVYGDANGNLYASTSPSDIPAGMDALKRGD